MTNIAMGNGPFIEVYQVYLLEMVIFHGYVSHNQMVPYMEHLGHGKPGFSPDLPTVDVHSLQELASPPTVWRDSIPPPTFRGRSSCRLGGSDFDLTRHNK